MDKQRMTASLYGIYKSNRNFADPYYWGKNQFNSSFPVSLACYMRDRQIPFVYIVDDGSGDTSISELSGSDLFATDMPNQSIFFAFESRFDPYSSLVHDSLKAIDLVTMSACEQNSFRPLEIKLTTLPDSATFDKKESEYGCELVVRNPTTRYMALSMVDSCKKRMDDIRMIFEPVCHKVRSWDNSAEIHGEIPELMEALRLFLDSFHGLQKPLLMQPVWKTMGRSPRLADNCLDIFVWSDFSLARLIMDSANENNQRITRPQRSAIRLARFLYEASTRGRVYQGPIYDGMTYGTLNDKEFSISGNKTNKYMRCARLERPVVLKQEIKNIIMGGGQRHLSPERRFDAIIFYSIELFKSQ